MLLSSSFWRLRAEWLSWVAEPSWTKQFALSLSIRRWRFLKMQKRERIIGLICIYSSSKKGENLRENINELGRDTLVRAPYSGMQREVLKFKSVLTSTLSGELGFFECQAHFRRQDFANFFLFWRRKRGKEWKCQRKKDISSKIRRLSSPLFLFWYGSFWNILL